MKGLYKPTQMDIANNALDITQPMHGVEIGIDWKRRVVWVNVDGVCALRICRAPRIDMNGGRDQQAPPMSTLNREEVRKHLLAQGHVMEEVDAYMGEFEHQDGEECWSTYFGSVEDANNDYVLYRKNVQDGKEP